MEKYFIILIFILSSSLSSGQSEKLSEDIIAIAEDLASEASDPEAVSLYMERLSELRENPVILNSADEKEISRLFFLSDFQIKALAEFVRSSGRIISVFEVANIPGFDRETVEMMAPFISLAKEVSVYTDSSRFRNSIITNLSLKSVQNDTASLGSMWKVLTKYRISRGGFSGGFTFEKDPGERFLTGTPSLPDFLSVYTAFEGSGIVRKIIIGDYSARFGQGTNINTGMRSGLSLTSPGYMAARDEIKPYTSTDENNFFRGVATEFAIKDLGITLFYSKKYSDATVEFSSDSGSRFIKNFYLTGIHNTESLLEKKDAVSESAIGIDLTYNLKYLRLGMLWSENSYSLPVIPVGNDPENRFDFTGDKNDLISVYYNSLIKRILLFGEITANNFKNYAYIQGISFRPSDRLTLNFLLRNYGSGYTAFHGNGPGSGSVNSIRKGVLGNFTFEAAKHLFITGGCDIQQFEWLRYRCSSPSLGVMKELKFRYLPDDKLSLEASYIYRLTVEDKRENSGIPEQNEILSRSIKSTFRYRFNDNLILGTRFDYKLSDPSGSKGVLLLQDVTYRFRAMPLSLWIRYCVFNTDDYESRFYTYENDLLYSFSVPALSGKGSRIYFLAGLKITRNAELRIKYAISSLNFNSAEAEDSEEFRIQIKITI